MSEFPRPHIDPSLTLTEQYLNFCVSQFEKGKTSVYMDLPASIRKCVISGLEDVGFEIQDSSDFTRITMRKIC